MIVLEWILVIFSWMLFLAGSFILASSLIGFLRYKDYFVKAHALKISNIYGISFILFAISLRSSEIVIFLQIFLIIILNILMTITILHSISRIALNHNVEHNGISRRKYNEIKLQEERREAEEDMKKRIKNEKEEINKKLSDSENS